MVDSVVPYIGTWIETNQICLSVRCLPVVPYIGTWIETDLTPEQKDELKVVPYIGTWIETEVIVKIVRVWKSYLI